MDVYIEYVLLDNFFMDALLAVLTLYALSKGVKWWRVVLAAAAGTAAAVLLPLLKVHIVLQFILRALSGGVLPLIFTRLKGFKDYLRVLLVFFMLTFLFGGACFAFMFIAEKNFPTAARLLYGGGAPLAAILAGCGFAAVITVKLALYFNKHRCRMRFSFKARITLLGKSAEVSGFLDSGNRLYDPLTNFPVVIVNLGVLYKLLGKEFLPALLSGGKLAGGIKARYIPYSAMAGGGGRLLVLRPEKIEIYSGSATNTIYDVMLGVSNKNIDGGGGEALLHPAFFCEGE